MSAVHVDYARIGRALAYYESVGYARIEVPWLVSKGIASVTKPESAPHVLTSREGDGRPDKSFVASAEQGFLYLIRKGFLPSSGRYVACTPCIRPNAVDETHVQRFVKVEPISYGEEVIGKDPLGELQRTIERAHAFFTGELPADSWPLEKIQMDAAGYEFDVEMDVAGEGLEIGSYGVRECDFCRWVYGTGLAEPRFSQAVYLTRR